MIGDRVRELLCDVRFRLRAVFRRRELDAAMDDELRFHLEHEAAKLSRAGLDPAEAMRRARLSFGGVQRYREESREARGTALFDSMVQDVRYAARQLRRAPGFAMAVVLTLALGVGAATTMFSVVDAVALHPLPFADGDRLLYVHQFSSACPRCYDVPVGNFVSLRDQLSTTRLVAMRAWSPMLRGRDRTDVLRGSQVTTDFFVVLAGSAGVSLGRGFASADSVHGAPPVAILSDAAWRERFGADPHVIGRALSLDGTSRTVIGVLRPAFTFPARTEIWTLLPIDAATAQLRSEWRVDVFGRARPGTAFEKVTAEIAAAGDRLVATYPRAMRGWRVRAEPMREWHDDLRPVLPVVLVAVALVLLVACVNLGALFLARITARRGELAVRAAMGAGTARVARQLLTESLVLSLAGAIGAVVLSVPAVRAIRGGVPEDLASYLPGWAMLHVDTRVLTFALAAAVAAGFVVAFGPVMRTRRVHLTAALHGGSRAGDGRETLRARRVLLAVQLAGAVVLLTTAGLLVRTVANMARGDIGIRPDHVLTLTLQLPVRGVDPVADRPAFLGDLATSVERLPGVVAAGTVSALPLSHRQEIEAFLVDGESPDVPLDRHPYARFQFVTAHYFRVMRIPLLRGRVFDARDVSPGRSGDASPMAVAAPRSGVAIVNAALVRKYLRGVDPLGQLLLFGRTRVRVVGVVGDVHHDGVNDDVMPELYLPVTAGAERAAQLAVRVAGDPAAFAPGVLRLIRTIDPEVAVNAVRPMDDLVDVFLSPYRLLAGIMLVFALVTLVIAAVGLFGVMSYLVVQRTREFGIRMAVGAAARDIVWLVLRQGLRAVGMGALAGGAFALIAARLIGFLLYGVGPADPITLLAVITTLVIVALGAACGPALGATRADPTAALRAE